LVKTERMQATVAEPAPGSAWLIGLAAWFVPGLGHVLLERWYRAALMGGAVWLCFFLGLAMGGHMYDLSNTEDWWSFLLQIPPMIANLGSGVLYMIFWVLGIGFADDPQQAARATYEYGHTFLLIAGLMNYLIMLDAFDIAAGRKS
jgi:hypothetical protein